MKKPSRKIEKDLIDEAIGLETKIPSKKIFKEEREKYPKKTEIVEISKAEITQDVEQQKAMAKEPLPLLAEEPLPSLVEAIVKSPLQEISKRKRRKKARKKRLTPRPVIFRLAKPCKVVCKPDICCRRTAPRKLIRYAHRFNVNIMNKFFLQLEKYIICKNIIIQRKLLIEKFLLY